MSGFGVQTLLNPAAPKEGRRRGPQGWGCHQRLGGDLRPVREGLRESVIPKGGGDTKCPQPGEKGKEAACSAPRSPAAPPKVPAPLQLGYDQQGPRSAPKTQGNVGSPKQSGDSAEGRGSLFHLRSLLPAARRGWGWVGGVSALDLTVQAPPLAASLMSLLLLTQWSLGFAQSLWSLGPSDSVTFLFYNFYQFVLFCLRQSPPTAPLLD